jgi:hypothetical protein
MQETPTTLKTLSYGPTACLADRFKQWTASVNDIANILHKFSRKDHCDCNLGHLMSSAS